MHDCIKTVHKLKLSKLSQLSNLHSTIPISSQTWITHPDIVPQTGWPLLRLQERPERRDDPPRAAQRPPNAPHGLYDHDHYHQYQQQQ